MWDNTVITNAGVELIKNTMSGETIVITAVKSGTGKVSVDVLAKQTEVVDEKQNGTIQSIKNKGNAISVSVLFENSGLAKGYTMNQIGIYAKTSDQTEILFAISQDNAGKEIPSESSMPYYSLVSNFNFSFSSDLSITSAVEPLGYVTLEAFEEHKNDTSNPHKVTKKQIGLDNVPNVATNDQTVTFNDITELSTISSGDKMSPVFAKIKLAISNLITHLNNKENPHGVTKKQIGLENVENKSSESIRSDLTVENIETALNYKPVSPTDFENYKSLLNGSLEGVGKIQMTSGKYKRMFFAEDLVKTDSSGKATTNNSIKDKIEALGGKWGNYSEISVFGYAKEEGVMISAHPDAVKSSDTYGKVEIRAYNADGSAHYDSGNYAVTPVVLLIFTDEA